MQSPDTAPAKLFVWQLFNKQQYEIKLVETSEKTKWTGKENRKGCRYSAFMSDKCILKTVYLLIEVYSLFLFDLFCVLVLVKTFASDTLYLILVIYSSFLRALYHPWKQLRVKSRKSNIRQLSREVAAKEKKRTHVPSAICWLFYFPSYYLRSWTCCFFQQYDAYFLSCLHSCESLIYLSPSGDSGHLK